jgi:glycosyltransferase involved in cell wall biosynthesis
MPEELPMTNTLIVISVLDGKGPTGVETHFNQVIARAHGFDIDARLVCPYPAQRLWANAANVLRRRLAGLDRERAEIFNAWVQGKIMEGKLVRMMKQAQARGRTVTLYAQDPLSAQVALRLKERFDCRVVLVIHYNISMADELVMKGEARRHGPLWRFALRTEQLALPRVDMLIFVSQFMRRVVMERLPQLAGARHAVIHNFIGEPSPPEPRKTFDADLIAIGTLEPRKNQAFLLRVLARARELGQRYTLTLVGNGPDGASLAALARELGIEDQVRFMGFQRNAARLIARHRVLVHAARVESMGIVLVEAMAAGRPVLAPAVGGIAEVFDDQIEGFHWPLDDIDAAAGLLVRVLNDEALYTRLAQAALLRYRTGFDSEMLVSHWLTALLGSHGPNYGGWQTRLHGTEAGTGAGAGVAAPSH